MKELLLIYIVSMVICWTHYEAIPAMIAYNIDKFKSDPEYNKNVAMLAQKFRFYITLFSVVPILNTFLSVVILFSRLLMFLGISKTISSHNVDIYKMLDKEFKR